VAAAEQRNEEAKIKETNWGYLREIIIGLILEVWLKCVCDYI
jgi:hypothetical protein